jgi:hypothetical protein
MKSSGVLVTLMLAAVAGYASGQGTCDQKIDGATDGAVIDGQCAAVAAAGNVGTAIASVATATCVGVCDMSVTLHKAACCTGTPWAYADAASCGDRKVWTTGSSTDDSTCEGSGEWSSNSECWIVDMPFKRCCATVAADGTRARLVVTYS